MVDTAQKDIRSQLDEVTEIVNRVLSVIRANSISNQGLDPKGLLQMTTEEYADHEAELQKISDEFDKRQKRLNKMTLEQMQEEISHLETASLVNALGGLHNG